MDHNKFSHLSLEMHGETSQASGDLNWMPKVASWRLAILAKIARGLVIIAKNVPALETGDCGEIGDFLQRYPECGKYSKWDAKSR